MLRNWGVEHSTKCGEYLSRYGLLFIQFEHSGYLHRNKLKCLWYVCLLHCCSSNLAILSTTEVAQHDRPTKE